MVLIRKYHSSDLEAVTDLMADLGYPTDVDSMKQRMKLIENNRGILHSWQFKIMKSWV